MTLRNEVTLMGGKEVDYRDIAIDVLKDGSNDHKIKAICLMCGTAYTVRPFICRCASNVFLRNVENGEIVNDSKS